MLYDTKTNFKQEIKKLKKMSFKDKIWYIKEYYLVHIIIILVLLFFSISIISNTLKKEPIFSSFFVNLFILEEDKKEIIDDFIKFAKLDETKDSWILDDSIKISLDNSSSPLENQQYILKLTATIISGQLDTIITEKELIDYFLGIDSFLPLNNILPKDFMKNNMDKLYIKENIDKIKNIYAINVSKSPLFKKFGIKEDIYFAIAKNSKNIDLSLKFLEYIYSPSI